MGAGIHGGFGATRGAIQSNVITADTALVGNGRGKELGTFAKKVKKDPGYTDVAIHGSKDSVGVWRIKNGEEEFIDLDQRRLATFLKHDKGYIRGKIRLLSCSTGHPDGTFAQNLANKMGVVVRAPSDLLHIWFNGNMVIGPDKYTNSGHWIDYYPQGRRRKK